MSKRPSLRMAQLLSSGSHSAMNQLLAHFQFEEERKHDYFKQMHEAMLRLRLKATLRGRPYLPVFSADHKIRPANWTDAPLIQS